MTTIRAMLIMTIMSSLIHNAGAMGTETPKHLLPVEFIPIEFFNVHNVHDFRHSIKYGNGAGTGVLTDIRLYWYRIPTNPSITPEAVEKSFTDTRKVNCSILQSWGYSEYDVQNYGVRVENNFNQRLQASKQIKNL